MEKLISKLELIENKTFMFDNYDEAYLMFREFMKENRLDLVSRLVNQIMNHSYYDWANSFLNDEVLNKIEEFGDSDDKCLIYNAIIYLAYNQEDEEKIINYLYKLSRIDKLVHKNITTSYLVGITTLLKYDLFDESISFVNLLLDRVEKFDIIAPIKFCAYVDAYQVYTHLQNPNITMINKLKSLIEDMLLDEEFNNKYGDAYKFVRLEVEWSKTLQNNNLYLKKALCDEALDRLKVLIDTEDVGITGISMFFDMLSFCIDIRSYDILKYLEGKFLRYLKSSEEKAKCLGVYAKYYEAIGDKDKALECYREYYKLASTLNTKNDEEKKIRYKDVFNRAIIYNENKNLQKSLMYDDATGCFSRDYLKKQFDMPFTGTVIIIDLDKLKSVNDEYGHLYGDMYIAYFSKTLKKYSDDFKASVYRFGGDEFVVTMNTTDKESAIKYIEGLYELFKGMHSINNEVLFIKFSSGIAIANDKLLSIAFNDADQAMYKMKSSNRNHYLIYEK